jgi:hypothetical protein
VGFIQLGEGLHKTKRQTLSREKENFCLLLNLEHWTFLAATYKQENQLFKDLRLAFRPVLMTSASDAGGDSTDMGISNRDTEH